MKTLARSAGLVLVSLCAGIAFADSGSNGKSAAADKSAPAAAAPAQGESSSTTTSPSTTGAEPSNTTGAKETTKETTTKETKKTVRHNHKGCAVVGLEDTKVFQTKGSKDFDANQKAAKSGDEKFKCFASSKAAQKAGFHKE